MRLLALTMIVALVALVGVGGASVSADADKGIVVIVNSGCPDDRAATKKLQLSDIQSMFLLSTTKWTDKDKTGVVTHPMASDTDEAKLFLREVLKKSQDELAKHWSKLKEDDGIDQPKGRKTSDEVFKQVSKDKATGAIGYVSISYFAGLAAEDQKKVKEIFRITDK